MGPIDAELIDVLREKPYISASVLPKHINALRRGAATFAASHESLMRDGRIDVRQLQIDAPDGFPLKLLVLRPATALARGPGLCFLHGGGMVSGDERTGIEALLDWVEDLGITIVSVGYRLAPEHPHPVPVQDCVFAFDWMADNAASIGIDDGPLMLAGTSAGGGLAAGVALTVRDRSSSPLSDLILMCPMLDDRARFPSSSALDAEGTWDARSNLTGWSALLGDRAGGPEVSAYAAPGRATDLSGMPATYLDVGAVETFRDEVIDFGARLAQAGVATELHVWAGAFHGFDVIAPESMLARSARAVRLDYLRRRLRDRKMA